MAPFGRLPPLQSKGGAASGRAQPAPRLLLGVGG
jgi:hypothetical protein